MSIDTPSIAYERGRDTRELVNALWGDTPAMQSAGVKYLPAMNDEVGADGRANQSYKKRLKETTLTNYLNMAVKGASSKVFSKPIVLGESLSPYLGWFDDIDLSGSNVNDFARQLFESSARDGITFILVDAPSDSGSANLQEQMDSNERPYLTHIEASQLIGWESGRIRNVDTLISVRIAESFTEMDDDYLETVGKQIRKIYKNFNDDGTEAQGCTWELWRESGSDWELYDSGLISLDYIPLVPFYTNRTGFMQGETYFMTLSYLNLEHWQSTSYQKNILNVARVPRMSGFGFQESEIEYFRDHGVHSGIFSTNDASSVSAGWIEAKGDSISHGVKDLERLEDKMAMLALDPMLKKATNNRVATVANIEASKSHSVLQSWALSLERALSDCVSIMLDYTNDDIEVELKVNDDYQVISDIEKRVKELREMRAMGEISSQTFLESLRDIDFLDREFDVALEKERIIAESALDGFVDNEPE